jgi:hypothetical protein
VFGSDIQPPEIVALLDRLHEAAERSHRPAASQDIPAAA